MPDYNNFDWQMREIETTSSQWIPSSINVRKTPFLNAGIVANYATFDAIRVSQKTYPNDGHDWYKIENSETSAYVSSSVITIVPKADPSPDSRYIIDLHPDTIIVTEQALPIVQQIFTAFCRNLLDRVNNPIPYEEGE